MKQNTRQRIHGVLIGGAVGDAMGMPTELWTQKMIQEEFPHGVSDFTAAMNKGATIRDLKRGQVTDDTINTVFIIEMLANTQGEISVEKYLKQLKVWSENSELANLVSGPSTRKALEMLAAGVPLTETGRFGSTNGAAMKIAPIGIVSDYRQLDQLVENVAQICLPTHNTGIAIAGASAIASSINYVIAGHNNLQEMYQLAQDAILLGLKKGYDIASASLVKRMDIAKKIVQDSPEKALTNIYELLGTGVETIETIPCVYALIELAQGNPQKVAHYAASIGGDTDTIGAIATSICGGMQPLFDKKTIQLLEQVNQLDFERLTEKLLPYVQISE